MFSQIWRRRDASSFGEFATNHTQLTLVTPPAVEPVNLTLLKQQTRIPYNDGDAILTFYISAAREVVETYLRRALITQTWDLTLDWGPAWVELPRPPLQSITGVYTTSLDNVESVVPSSVYIVNTNTNLVGLNIGNVWPLHRGKAGFRVRYVAGYGDTPDTVPFEIRRIILAVATTMDNTRDAAILTVDQQAQLRPYRLEGEMRMSKGMAREDLLA